MVRVKRTPLIEIEEDELIRLTGAIDSVEEKEKKVRILSLRV